MPTIKPELTRREQTKMSFNRKGVRGRDEGRYPDEWQENTHFLRVMRPLSPRLLITMTFQHPQAFTLTTTAHAGSTLVFESASFPIPPVGGLRWQEILRLATSPQPYPKQIAVNSWVCGKLPSLNLNLFVPSQSLRESNSCQPHTSVRRYTCSGTLRAFNNCSDGF